MSEYPGTSTRTTKQHVAKFVRTLSRLTKVHLRATYGTGDAANPHAHLILQAPVDEIARYRKALRKIDVQRLWLGRDLHFVPFWRANWGNDHSKLERTFSYVLIKHKAQTPVSACPQKYAACRKGVCTHIGQSNVTSD